MVCGGPDQWSLLTHTRSDGCGPIGRVKLTCFGVNLRMTIGLVSAIFGPNFNEINDLQVLLPGQLVPSPLCVIQRRLNECSPKPRVVGSIPASRAKSFVFLPIFVGVDESRARIRNSSEGCPSG